MRFGGASNWLAAIAGSAVVLAYAVSITPGRMSARTPTAVMLNPK